MSISSLALAAKKVIDAAWLHGDAYDLSSQAAFALESAQLLQSPETAAELERLRKYAENRQSREEELLAVMGQYDLATSPDAWDLGMTVIAHLEGPHRPSAPEELEPGLRRLIEQLRSRVAELEARLAEDTRPADEDPIAFALTAEADGITQRIAPIQALQADEMPALKMPAIAVACPMCGAQPGALCTSHSGTRPRRHDVHRARSHARQAAETGGAQ